MYSVPSDKNVQKRNNLAQELENEKAEMLSKGLNPYVEFRRREIENEVFLITYCSLIIDFFCMSSYHDFREVIILTFVCRPLRSDDIIMIVIFIITLLLLL